jgi:hypothetical protein
VGAEEFEEEKKKRMEVRGKHSFVATWAEGDVVVRQELFPHGGSCLPLFAVRWHS